MMQWSVAMALGALMFGASVPASEPATGEPVEVVEPAEEWSTSNDPAVTGRCMGREIPPVPLPEIPEGVGDREAYLDAYYETYARTFCEIRVSKSTLWV